MEPTVGFEPTIPLLGTDYKSVALNRLATSASTTLVAWVRVLTPLRVLQESHDDRPGRLIGRLVRFRRAANIEKTMRNFGLRKSKWDPNQMTGSRVNEELVRKARRH